MEGLVRAVMTGWCWDRAGFMQVGFQELGELSIRGTGDSRRQNPRPH